MWYFEQIFLSFHENLKQFHCIIRDIHLKQSNYSNHPILRKSMRSNWNHFIKPYYVLSSQYHVSNFLARCKARVLKSLLSSFSSCGDVFPKFVDFWHFYNLICWSMIRVHFYNVFKNFFLNFVHFSKDFYFYKIWYCTFKAF